jgi:transposase InsO family protein
VFFLQEKSQTQ